MFGKKKSPQARFIAADKKKQKLRDKRAKLSCDDLNYKKKVNAINAKIHNQNVIMDMAKTEIKYPPVDKSTKTTNINVNFNKNVSKKSYEIHGHYHAASLMKFTVITTPHQNLRKSNFKDLCQPGNLKL